MLSIVVVVILAAVALIRRSSLLLLLAMVLGFISSLTIGSAAGGTVTWAENAILLVVGLDVGAWLGRLSKFHLRIARSWMLAAAINLVLISTLGVANHWILAIAASSTSVIAGPSLLKSAGLEKSSLYRQVLDSATLDDFLAFSVFAIATGLSIGGQGAVTAGRVLAVAIMIAVFIASARRMAFSNSKLGKAAIVLLALASSIYLRDILLGAIIAGTTVVPDSRIASSIALLARITAPGYFFLAAAQLDLTKVAAINTVAVYSVLLFASMIVAKVIASYALRTKPFLPYLITTIPRGVVALAIAVESFRLGLINGTAYASFIFAVALSNLVSLISFPALQARLKDLYGSAP
jgi:Kef-type K+ transport system membrane component KefB